MTWRDTITSPEWLQAVTAHRRTTASRVEVVTTDGRAVQDIDVDAVSVSLRGTQEAQWSAQMTFSDPELVPRSTTSPLDGRSGLRLRVWWRLLTTAGWKEIPICTVIPEDATLSDSGLLTGTVPGRDPLEVVARAGYGAHVIDVGGMTVDAALRQLFSTLAPGWPTSIEPSDATLPAHYELWARSPGEDWREIAAMAGHVVRTDRMGVITSTKPTPTSVVSADWQEGPACAISDMEVRHTTSSIPRRVVVVSTHPDVDPPVVGEWINPDADAQTILTETRIESSTVTSTEGAASLARLSGERWARRQVAVEVSVPPRPDLDYRDLIQLSRVQVDVAGVHEISAWDLQLAGSREAPSLMRVQMLTRLG